MLNNYSLQKGTLFIVVNCGILLMSAIFIYNCCEVVRSTLIYDFRSYIEVNCKYSQSHPTFYVKLYSISMKILAIYWNGHEVGKYILHFICIRSFTLTWQMLYMYIVFFL